MKKVLIILSCLSIILISSCEKEDIDTPQQNEPTAPVMPIGFEAWANLFDGEGVGAIHGQGEATFIFNLSGTKYAWFENEKILGIRELKAANSHFKNLPLANVGAMGTVKGRFKVNDPSTWNNSIMIYNVEGTKYTIITPKSYTAIGAFDDTDFFSFSPNTYTPYDMWEDGSCPFNTIGALYSFYSHEGDGYLTIWFANKGGDKMYDLIQGYAVPPNISAPYATNTHYGRHYVNGSPTQVNFDMTSIGAMSTVTLTTNKNYRVFFTADGKHFKIWASHPSNPEVSKLYSLY